MKAVICPFCGVVTEAPHERQEVCISALQGETDRTRGILEGVPEPLPTASIAEDSEPSPS